MLLSCVLFLLSLFSFFDLVVVLLSFPVLFIFSYSYSGFFDGVFFSDYFSILLIFITLWVFSFYS